MQFYNVNFSCELILIWNFIANIMYGISSSSLFAYIGKSILLHTFALECKKYAHLSDLLKLFQ